MPLLTLARPLLLSTLILASGAGFAENMTIDDADSLDFEAFHRKHDQAVKLWDSKESQKAYPQQAAEPAANAAAAPDSADREQPLGKAGDRFDIRQAYRPADPANSGLHAAMAKLQQQMVSLCPNGWLKTSERVLPAANGDYFLHYELECL